MKEKKRFVHYLAKNEANQIPTHIIAVDTETRIIHENGGQSQYFKLGYAIYMRKSRNEWIEKEYPLNSIEDFYSILDDLCKQGIKVYVYAHNASFDYTILKMDTYFSSRDIEITTWAIDSVFIVKAQKKHLEMKNGKEKEVVDYAITFTDTMNYYPTSLKKLGEAFGCLKMDTPDFEATNDIELMAYCRQDVVVLTQVLKQYIEFIRENDLGNFKLTIASQAMATFRHRFMTSNLLVHDYQEILDMETESYRGGRCEAFRMGKYNNVYKLDINSMYPYVMKVNRYPTEPVSYEPVTDITIDDLKKAFEDNIFMICKVKVTLNFPALGIKRDKLLFPVGNIIQTLTSPELKYIIENPEVGRIEEILSGVSYLSDYLFSEYVDYFYKMKTTAETNTKREIAKRFLNALYGKFAQRSFPSPEIETDIKTRMIINDAMDVCGTCVLDNIEGNKDNRFVRLGNELYRIEPPTEGLGIDSMPIVSSAVTAYARILLYKLMNTAGLDNVYYCDTDSLFCNQAGYENLLNAGEVSQDELGKMKLEEIGSVHIRGAKNYIFNGKVKLKGVKQNALRFVFNTCQGMAKAETELPTKFIQHHFVTKKRRYQKGTKDGIVRVEGITRIMRASYDKGIVLPDGTVTPLKFTDFDTHKQLINTYNDLQN